MAVRVVTDAPFAQPDGARDAEPFREDPLVVVACHPGVANLLVAQQPFLRDEHQAIAAHVDAAAFEDDAVAGSKRIRPTVIGRRAGSFGPAWPTRLDALEPGDLRDGRTDQDVAG